MDYIVPLIEKHFGQIRKVTIGTNNYITFSHKDYEFRIKELSNNTLSKSGHFALETIKGKYLGLIYSSSDMTGLTTNIDRYVKEMQTQKERRDLAKTAGLIPNTIMENALKRIKKFYPKAQFSVKSTTPDGVAAIKWPKYHYLVSEISIMPGSLHLLDNSSHDHISSSRDTIKIPEYSDPSFDPDMVVDVIVEIAKHTEQTSDKLRKLEWGCQAACRDVLSKLETMNGIQVKN